MEELGTRQAWRRFFILVVGGMQGIKTLFDLAVPYLEGAGVTTSKMYSVDA